MTVRSLILALQSVPDQDAIIVLQKDGEGNGYSPLAAEDGDALYVDRYHADSPCSGDVYHGDDSDAPEGGVPCVVLWP